VQDALSAALVEEMRQNGDGCGVPENRGDAAAPI
jgi:hypothetical protein